MWRVVVTLADGNPRVFGREARQPGLECNEGQVSVRGKVLTVWKREWKMEV